MAGGRAPWLLLLLAPLCAHVVVGVSPEPEPLVTSEPDPGPLRLGHPSCALKLDPGPCKASHLRFHFSLSSRQCEPFDYGGCDGNDNNFESLEGCQERCLLKKSPPKRRRGKFKYERPPLCLLEDDPGICRGLIPRYYYRRESGRCETFNYGGCLGNENNFWSLEDCQATCQDQGPSEPQEERAEASNHSTSLSMPGADQSTSLSMPGADQSTSLSMPGADQSTSLSMPGADQSTSLSMPGADQSTSLSMPVASGRRVGFPAPTICQHPADRGHCGAKEKRFHYDSVLRKCLAFSYSGCGGNENNFNSRKACLKVCKKHSLKIRRKKIKGSLKPSPKPVIAE